MKKARWPEPAGNGGLSTGGLFQTGQIDGVQAAVTAESLSRFSNTGF
ncbi:hypothetical protein ACVDG5_014905 [Mesorhizobium sp. ORM6]